jgi:hypothetical protein
MAAGRLCRGTERGLAGCSGEPTSGAYIADDLGKRGPQDRSRVNVNEPYDVAWWTQRFGVSEQALRDAVKKAGVSAKDLQTLLKH